MLNYIGVAVALWIAIDLLIVLLSLIGHGKPQAEEKQRGAQIRAI